MRAFDLSILRAIHEDWHSPFLDPVFALLSYAGLGFFPAILVVILLAMKRRRAGTVMAVSLVAGALLMSNFLKGQVGRERPSNLAWTVPQEPLLMSSFPSGHTTTGFCVAFALLLSPPGSRYDRLWQALAFFYAVGVGVSRIYRGVHWPTDVLGGVCLAALSAAGASFLVNFFADRRPNVS